MVSTLIKGHELEDSVAGIYHALNSREVTRNQRINGHELDIYVEIATPDGLITRLGIDCKNYKSKIGVNDINIAAAKLVNLRMTGAIDIPVIVCMNGFTPEAINSLSSLGVKAVLYSDLIRQLADFVPYITSEIIRYEKKSIYEKGIYRELTCISERKKTLGKIDDFVLDWFGKDGKFLILLGDYGTGKTTFSEHLYWKLAQRYINDPAKERIPILVKLKRYRNQIHIRSLLTDLLLHEYDINIRNFGTLKKLNEKGRVFFIFDAFDEMTVNSSESEVLSNFREISSLVCDKSNIILTCRTHYFKDHDQLHKAHQGTSLYKEIDNKHKHKIVYLNKYTKDDIENVVRILEPDNWEEYLAIIDNTYNLYELSKHPILLEMVVKSLPSIVEGEKVNTPSDLYTIYTKYWLDRDDWRSRMTHEQRKYFSKEIAFYMQQNALSYIHYSSIPGYVKRHFPGITNYRELDYFEEDIRTCTFLIRDDKGNYSFVHKSFMEYFTALCASSNILDGEWPCQLWRGRNHDPTNWVTHETSHFCIDMIENEPGGYRWLLSIVNERNDGILIYIICKICSHSKMEKYRHIFDLLLSRIEIMDNESLDYRSKILELVNENHTENWEETYKSYAKNIQNTRKKQNTIYSLESNLKKIRKRLQKK